MELSRLIEELSVPGTLVRQTHISVVFLAGDYVYKVRKPVALGFLDFTTLEARRADCLEEVRLNKRLALDVYLGVVPVARGPLPVARYASHGQRVTGHWQPVTGY